MMARTWFCSTVKLLGLVDTLFSADPCSLNTRSEAQLHCGLYRGCGLPCQGNILLVEIAGLSWCFPTKTRFFLYFFVRFILIRMWPPCARGPYVRCCLLQWMFDTCRAQEHPIRIRAGQLGWARLWTCWLLRSLRSLRTNSTSRLLKIHSSDQIFTLFLGVVTFYFVTWSFIPWELRTSAGAMLALHGCSNVALARRSLNVG